MPSKNVRGHCEEWAGDSEFLEDEFQPIITVPLFEASLLLCTQVSKGTALDNLQGVEVPLSDSERVDAKGGAMICL